MIEDVLKDTLEHKKFLGYAEASDSEEKRINLCKKYLSAKGVSVDALQSRVAELESKLQSKLTTAGQYVPRPEPVKAYTYGEYRDNQYTISSPKVEELCASYMFDNIYLDQVSADPKHSWELAVREHLGQQLGYELAKSIHITKNVKMDTMQTVYTTKIGVIL